MRQKAEIIKWFMSSPEIMALGAAGNDLREGSNQNDLNDRDHAIFSRSVIIGLVITRDRQAVARIFNPINSKMSS